MLRHSKKSNVGAYVLSDPCYQGNVQGIDPTSGACSALERSLSRPKTRFRESREQGFLVSYQRLYALLQRGSSTVDALRTKQPFSVREGV